MAKQYTGMQAIERAARRRARDSQPVSRSVRQDDYVGAARRWFAGPPPARLADEHEMEQHVHDYQGLRSAR